MSYCQYVQQLERANPHVSYHDQQYGFPIVNDDELFGRLILDINQAGLNWTIILNKQENFRKAYSNYSIAKIASYNKFQRERLLGDAGIIRNKLKVDATIHNAQVIIGLQNEYGSFKNWLNLHHPLTQEEWVKLFKKTFKFTGGEITNEFLMSTGYLSGAHVPECHIFKKIAKLNPPWMTH